MLAYSPEWKRDGRGGEQDRHEAWRPWPCILEASRSNTKQSTPNGTKAHAKGQWKSAFLPLKCFETLLNKQYFLNVFKTV